MNIEQLLKSSVAGAIQVLFGVEVEESILTINLTKKEFEGDYTVVTFPLIKVSKKSPEETGTLIGNALKEKLDIIARFNVVKGFLNISFTDSFWLSCLQEIHTNDFAAFPQNGKKVLLEYCSPNTNKPLHIGHVRNMLLGYSMTEILKANGYDVTTVSIYNDRGIAICKSMAAYKRECDKRGVEITPKTEGKKGDHLVGDFYVAFGQQQKLELDIFSTKYEASLEEIGFNRVASEEKNKNYQFFIIIQRLLKELIEGYSEDLRDNPIRTLLNFMANLKVNEIDRLMSDAHTYQFCRDCITKLELLISDFISTSIFAEAISLLHQWEAGDADTIALWKKMNGWVYEGYQVTYDLMGVKFDRDYYESETYKLGKEIIDEGLEKGVFYKRTDGAVAIDLTAEGLDEKIMLRSDGTSLYMTQDLGTADVRYQEYHMDCMIYVVANEQDYHFKVLKLCLQKLGKQWADGIHHLSYSLVESPTGRFKSREGKTADADDMIAEVLQIAEEKTKELGKTEGFSEEDAQALYKTIGLGALKFFILRVNPYKKIIFNPEESIDFHGHTGPFIQYSHARIKSIIRKYESNFSTTSDFIKQVWNIDQQQLPLHTTEKELIIHLYEYQNVLRSSAEKYDPAELANYIYELAKLYNKLYNELPILVAPDYEKFLRLTISKVTGDTIRKGMKLLGIEVPDKM
jgi:arginyl-tRNA synthetase